MLLQELPTENSLAIERATDLPFAHRALFPAGIPGKGVLARHPLRDVRLERHADGATTVHGVLVAPRGEIEFVDVHSRANVSSLGPWVSFDEHLEQWVSEFSTDRPVLVAGDFNLASNCALLDPLRDAGFRDAFTEVGAGLGLSFPLFLSYRGIPLPPLVRIDHAWFRGLEPFGARLLADAGSDHLPLLARFR